MAGVRHGPIVAAPDVLGRYFDFKMTYVGRPDASRRFITLDAEELMELMQLIRLTE